MPIDPNAHPANQPVEVGDTVREAALAAMKAAGVPTEGDWPQPDEHSDEDAASEEDQEDLETGDGPDPDAEDAGDTEDGGDDIPDEYFGVDLSALPPETKAEVYAKLREQDQYIQSIQRQKAELERQQTPVPEPEAPQELSDDDLMEVLGYSSDDPMYEVKKEVALPLARIALETNQAVQAMLEQQQIAAFENHWNSTLDRLEEAHGKLPYTRDQLIDIATEANIGDPTALYATLALEGRKTTSQAVEAAKAKVKAKAKAPKPPSTNRPRSGDVQPEAPTSLDPKAAALKAAKDMGVDWGEVLKNTT